MNLEGANSGGLGDGSPPAGSRGGAPVRGLGDFRPPEADDFSQLKGYLDVLWRDLVTSGILGAAWPPSPPLNPPVLFVSPRV